MAAEKKPEGKGLRWRGWEKNISVCKKSRLLNI